MKKLIFLLLVVTISFPFFNALFQPSVEIESTFLNKGVKHKVHIYLNKMVLSAYHRLDDGSASVTRGIYGVLNDTYFVIYFSRRFAALPEDHREKSKELLRKNFLRHDNLIAILKLKRIEESHYIVRYYFPLAEDDNYYYKDGAVTYKR